MSYDPIHDAPLQDAAPVARIARAESRLAMLRELAELGMELTRELARRALETPPADTPASQPRHDPAESFARLSRAVRLTLALEAKADEELAALMAGASSVIAPEVAPTAAPTANDFFSDPEFRTLPSDYPSAHRNTVRDAVYDVLDNEITEIRQAHEILNDLYERLREGDRYDAFINRPLRESVEAICEDLGLHPDWSRWTGDGWPPPPPGPRTIWSRLWAPHTELLKMHHEARAEKARQCEASP